MKFTKMEKEKARTAVESFLNTGLVPSSTDEWAYTRYILRI